MLDNVITIQHDLDTTPVDNSYRRYQEHMDRTIYISGDHTIDSRDILTVRREMPTRTGNFRGMAKPSFKFTKDISVAGYDQSTTITSPLIGNVSFSVPVGAAAVEIDQLLDHIVSGLQNSALRENLIKQLEV